MEFKWFNVILSRLIIETFYLCYTDLKEHVAQHSAVTAQIKYTDQA